MPILEKMFGKQFDVSEKRLAICRECVEFNQSTTRCAMCGCFMEYKTKLMSSECPLGKWKKE